MSATSDAIQSLIVKAAGAYLASPAGQKMLKEAEQMILDNLPGWEGAVLRGSGSFLHALEPHEVESIGFSRTGRDGGG